MKSIGHNSGSERVYAITFDLDTNVLQDVYAGPSWRNAYSEIRGELEKSGFYRQQGSVYFGDNDVNSVTCVLAIQDLSEKFDWFEPAVRDIRMLRIEEDNDLMPSVQRGAKKHKPS